EFPRMIMPSFDFTCTQLPPPLIVSVRQESCSGMEVDNATPPLLCLGETDQPAFTLPKAPLAVQLVRSNLLHPGAPHAGALRLLYTNRFPIRARDTTPRACSLRIRSLCRPLGAEQTGIPAW